MVNQLTKKAISNQKGSSTKKILLKRKRSKSEEGFFTDDFYEDNGCEVSSKCLECPLTQCRYDDFETFEAMKRFAKDYLIINYMRRYNLSVLKTAKKFGVTERTIFRIMARVKKTSWDVTGPDMKLLLELQCAEINKGFRSNDKISI